MCLALRHKNLMVQVCGEHKQNAGRLISQFIQDEKFIGSSNDSFPFTVNENINHCKLYHDLFDFVWILIILYVEVKTEKLLGSHPRRSKKQNSDSFRYNWNSPTASAHSYCLHDLRFHFRKALPLRGLDRAMLRKEHYSFRNTFYGNIDCLRFCICRAADMLLAAYDKTNICKWTAVRMTCLTYHMYDQHVFMLNYIYRIELKMGVNDHCGSREVGAI